MPRFFRFFLIFSVSVITFSGNFHPVFGKKPAVRAPGKILRLKTVEVFDSQGWGRPVVAQSLLLPADWRVSGGIRWKTGSVCAGDLIAEHFTASSPDGRLVFEILPQTFWQWSSSQLGQTEIRMRGCRALPPLDAAGVLQRYVIPYFRRGATVLSIQPFPAAAKAAYEELYRIFGPAYLQQPNMSVKTDAVKTQISYTIGSRKYDEIVTVNLFESKTMTVAGPYFSFYVNPVYAFRAPEGQFRKFERLFATIVGSVRTNPVWERALVQVSAKINAGISRAAVARARIWSQAMNQIGETRVRTWEHNQNTMSKVSRSWSRAFRGVEGYVDPITKQTVELTSGYQTAWSDG